MYKQDKNTFGRRLTDRFEIEIQTLTIWFWNDLDLELSLTLMFIFIPYDGHSKNKCGIPTVQKPKSPSLWPSDLDTQTWHLAMTSHQTKNKVSMSKHSKVIAQTERQTHSMKHYLPAYKGGNDVKYCLLTWFHLTLILVYLQEFWSSICLEYHL